MKIFIPTAFARAGGWLARARRARAAMTLLLLLVTTTTARAQGSVSYRVYNASTNQFEDGVAASTTAVTEETTEMSEGWYVVNSDVTISGRIEVTGTVNLILCDGATLTATQGLHVPTGVTLNIYGQSDGSGGLTATQGGSDQAGIGGNNGEVSGTITIHGGNITSTGGWSGAGIGGGHNQPCGSITIYGGTVNAHGGDRAAGIGGGTGEYSGGSITIKGGSVTARANTYSGYDNSQAIGVGQSNNAGTCTLNIGNMKVYNSADATTPVASTDRESTCRSKYVRLTTCEHNYVNNECTYCGAEQNFIPIPYLVYDTESECFVQHTANVATYVKATTTTIGVAGSETYYAVKNDVTISSRIEVLGTVHLILCDGKTLTATGGITVHEGNTLNIHGQEGGTGAIVATSSGGNNAAIGTLADAYTLGTINFHGGTITATGGAWSAAIGGGVGCGGGTINIYGGHISATATNPNQGIQQAFGHGSSGPDVSLSIADGLRAYANNSSTPVAYNNRESALHHKTAVVEPCTQHNLSGNTCTYCGIKICSVTYDANNATSGTTPTDANEYESHQTVTVLGNTGNLERNGYTFIGWNTEADGSGVSYPMGATFVIRDNTTLYADWSSVLELAGNADNSGTISAAADGKKHRVVLANRTLYRDGTWNTLVLPFNLANLNSTPLEGFTVKTLQSSTLVNGELTLNFANANSIEAGKTYIVKWDQTPISNLVNPVFEDVLISDATANVSTTYADFIGSYAPINDAGLLLDAHNPNGDAMHAAIRAKLNGYSVSCYTKPDTNYPATSIPFSADGNVTLWTTCTRIDYTITYNLNGGTNHPSNPATYNIDSETITLQTPSKTNYTFGGWFDNEDCAGNAVTTIAHGSYGNITLYAKWLADNLELVANGDNSSAISEAAAIDKSWNVILNGYTLYRDSEWNTLCLPFNLATLSGTPLEGFTVKTLSESAFNNGKLTLNFANANSIEAGKPYIVKWTLPGVDLLIHNKAEWDAFADRVNGGETFAGKVVRLADDFDNSASPVTKMVGNATNKTFNGTLDGNGRTLTVNIDGTSPYTAPFCYLNGATIKNLRIAGSITSTNTFLAGLAGCIHGGTVTLQNCDVNATLTTNSSEGYPHNGGIVGEASDGSTLTVNNCLFSGKLLRVVNDGTGRQRQNAGLVGCARGIVTISNCLLAPTVITMSTWYGEVIVWIDKSVHRYGKEWVLNYPNVNVQVDNCYYNSVGGAFESKSGGSEASTNVNTLVSNLGTANWEVVGGNAKPKMTTTTTNFADIVNPVFENVFISDATANVSTTYADFIGSYAPITDDGLLLDAHNPAHGAMHAAIRAKRVGYTFGGWYTDAGLTTPATTIPFATNDNVTIYTKWTPTKYTITYNLDGGTNHADNPATYNIESATITLQAPTKAGHTFAGWFNNEDCTGNAVTTIAHGSHGNVTLYAKWLAELELANNGDNSDAISEAAASGKYYNVTLADRTIYKDGDWNTLVLPFNLATLTGTPLEGLTVKTLESSTYSDGTLTMNFSDATSIEAGKPYIVKWDQTPISNLVNPVFEEVLTSDATANISTDHANFIGSYAPITDTDLLLDAHNPNGDAMHAALRLTLSEPTRDGYTFGGWYTDNGLTTPLSTTIPFATNGNVTLYGKWTPITYTVRFNKNHDDASGTMDDQQFTYGTEQALTANAFTAPTGYMFAGWSTTIDGAVEYTDGQSVSNLAIVQDAVVNLYAQWSEYCTLFAEGSTNQWMTWCDDDEWSVAAAPVKVYTVSGISGSTVTLTEENSGCIPANTPLLIQRTENSTSAITVPLRTKGTTASTLFSAEATDCTFYGNPTDQTITTGDYFTANQSYVLYGDKFLLVDTDGGIASHRCLLTLTSPAGARRLNIIFDDGSLPSKVLSVESEEKTDDWYTIDGRKLSQQPTKKGLYIYNGKKTVIK